MLILLRIVGGALFVCAVTWISSPGVAQIDAGWGFRLPAIGQGIGILLIAGASAVIQYAQFHFVQKGGGTGVPGDAPHHLVIAGPYRWVRNPLYLSGNSILLGLALVLTSPTLLLMTCTSVLLFHLFIVIIEEPQLVRRYGEEYLAYRRTVPRWIPRRPKI